MRIKTTEAVSGHEFKSQFYSYVRNNKKKKLSQILYFGFKPVCAHSLFTDPTQCAVTFGKW